MMENSVRLQQVLRLKPEEATAIARAYEIREIKLGFLSIYRPSRDGLDPLIAFANKVIDDSEYREKCNGPLCLVEEMKIPSLQHF